MEQRKISPPEIIKISNSVLFEGDAMNVLRHLPDESIQTVITSPPYWGLRDYGIIGQIGHESKLESYINRLVSIFAEVRRVLKPNGTFWLNIGDGYTSGNRRWRAPDKKNPARAMSTRPDTPDGLKPKDLLGVPWRLAFALQQDGWYLRSDIIWDKPNAMPESVRDRPTRSHEYLFLFSKEEKYFFNNHAIMEPADHNFRNKRSVWHINTFPFSDAHFATFPPKLIEPCVLAGSKQGDYILDPFFGSGTVGLVCQQTNRRFVGVELNPAYIKISVKRLKAERLKIVKMAG